MNKKPKPGKKFIGQEGQNATKNGRSKEKDIVNTGKDLANLKPSPRGGLGRGQTQGRSGSGYQK